LTTTNGSGALAPLHYKIVRFGRRYWLDAEVKAKIRELVTNTISGVPPVVTSQGDALHDQPLAVVLDFVKPFRSGWNFGAWVGCTAGTQIYAERLSEIYHTTAGRLNAIDPNFQWGRGRSNHSPI
jgi:hypothetical protein